MTTPIFCFDLDGTLLDSSEKIHPKDIEILNNPPAGIFIPCTGRPLGSVVTMFHRNGLFQNQPIPFAMVTQNGSAIHKPGGELIQYHSFPEDVLNRILDIFELFPDVSFMLTERERNVLMHPSEFGIHWMERFMTPPSPYDESCRKNPMGKVSSLCDDVNVYKKLTSYLSELPIEIGVSMAAIIDMNPKGISKRTGVQELMDYLGIQGSPIFAAGDGENDLDLFTLANKTFTPATSPNHVKEQSDLTVDIPQNGLLSSMLDAAFC
jgi:hypothetical protein